MQRREYLIAAGAAGAAAGCSSLTGDGSSEATSTETETETTTATATRTTTETATPEPAALSVVEIDAPSQIETGEDWSISVIVENTGEQRGSFDANILYETPDGESLGSDFISMSVPGGEQETWTSEFGAWEQEAEVVFRFEDYDARAEMTVVPATTRPEVLYANLVSSWEQFGDASANAISSATEGEVISIASRHRYYLHEGTFEIFEQIDVFDSDNNRVGNNTYTDEQIFEGTGYSEFEHALRFDTQGWGTGTFTARVRVRDEVTGEVSNIVETEFELV